jgi:hypothetical protein
VWPEKLWHTVRQFKRRREHSLGTDRDTEVKSAIVALLCRRINYFRFVFKTLLTRFFPFVSSRELMFRNIQFSDGPELIESIGDRTS